jgi:hypothetical protein
MQIRLVLAAVVLALTAYGCSSDNSNPTAPDTALVAGHYVGTGSYFASGGSDCTNNVFGFFSQQVSGDVTQTGATLTMEALYIDPDDDSEAVVVCNFEGPLTGSTFNARLLDCQLGAGTNPLLGIQCPDGSTRNASFRSGFWAGEFINNGSRIMATIDVTLRTVDPATGEQGEPILTIRDVDLFRQ